MGGDDPGEGEGEGDPLGALIAYHSQSASLQEVGERVDEVLARATRPGTPAAVSAVEKVQTLLQLSHANSDLDFSLLDRTYRPAADDLIDTLIADLEEETGDRPLAQTLGSFVAGDWLRKSKALGGPRTPIIGRRLPLTKPCPGYVDESGTRLQRALPAELTVLEPERDLTPLAAALQYQAPYYFFAERTGTEPPIVLVVGVTQQEVELVRLEALYLARERNTPQILPGLYHVSEVSKPKLLLAAVLKYAPDESLRRRYRRGGGDGLLQELLKFEADTVIRRYKFGLLYAAAGQSTEVELYNNVSVSAGLHTFLQWFGEHVALLGFPHFRGGLDVKNNTTGTHSVYTRWRDYEVMLHVAPFLPYSSTEPQQLEKKRHIGNDIVVLVYQDEAAAPFDPASFSSQFNHIFFVIRKTSSGYLLNITRKTEIPYFGPAFPDQLFQLDSAFHSFLLAKLINAERTALLQSPAFQPKMLKTRATLLEDISTRYKKK